MIQESHESRKFSSQTIEASNGPSCRTSHNLWNKTGKVGTHDNNIYMPDYFRSSTNKAVDKRGSEVLTNKIHNEFSVFSGIGCCDSTLEE